MRIGADDLAAALRRPLGPLYTVVANEPLLGHEALAALRARAREEGYGERTVLTSESGFRWEALRAAGDSLSLFASRRLVEVRVPTGKPGREGGQALADYAKRLPPDTVTLVSLPALDWSGMKAAWLKALEAAGVLVMADPFPRDRLVGWIETRLAKNGQRAAPDTLAFLADRTHLDQHQLAFGVAALGEIDDLDDFDQAIQVLGDLLDHLVAAGGDDGHSRQ